MERPTREQLEQWYLTERRTTRQIAQLTGWSQPWVAKMLRDFNIPRRARCDYPPPVAKGSHLSSAHKSKIADALKGNENWKDPETCIHHNSQKQTVPCTFCGKPVLKKRCHIGQYRSFCGQGCLNKWKKERLTGEANPRYSRVAVSCSWCGKEMLRRKGDAAKDKNFFCSAKHNGLWKAANLVGEKVYNWKGGYEPYYGPTWRAQRRKAWERDGYTCQRCGIKKTRNPDVHHIRPFRTFGLKNSARANDLTNLICLCNRCHTIVECGLEKENRRK